MIFSNSRYSSGVKGQVLDNHSPTISTYVVRSRLKAKKQEYFNYVWRIGDRLDQVSLRYLGDENLWWEIMDSNPEILDPLHISPGTVLRIPNA